MNWNEIHNLSAPNSTASWIDVELDLTQDHAGKEFYLRLLFKSNSMNNAEGFRIDDLVVFAPTVYGGRIEMHHTDYLLGVTSFSEIDAPKAKGRQENNGAKDPPRQGGHGDGEPGGPIPVVVQ